MKICENCYSNKIVFKSRKNGKLLCRNCKRDIDIYGLTFKKDEERPNQLNLIGKKFGRLFVVKRIKSQNQRTRYECICDCGNKLIAIGSKIKRGNTKSCGCLLKELKKLGLCGKGRILPFGISSRNVLINNYKLNAKNKGQEFKLSNDELIHFFEQECYYCGAKPSGIIYPKGSNGAYVYNGIDRLNNNVGYIISNCVSCCKWCNYRKNKTHHDKFVEWISRVYLNLKKKDKSKGTKFVIDYAKARGKDIKVVTK